MPGFELEQVDGGQPIDLPYGETVIGRGPFLGVSDKRVSRNHGILENMGGQLRIKPTHLNPCFVQASLEAPSEPLEKDQWHCLNEGAIFSLLPGKYIYRVQVVTEENTQSNSQGFEEETQAQAEENSNPSRVSEETLEYNLQSKRSASLTPETTPSGQEEEDTREPAATSSSNQVAGVLSSAEAVETVESAPLTPRKKRVLPAWMGSATPAAQSPSTVKATTKRAPAQAASKTPTAQSKRATVPKRSRARRSPSGGEEEEEDEDEEHSDVEQRPKKRVKKLHSDTEESQEQAPAPKPSRERSLEDKLSEDSDEEGKGRGRRRAEAVPRSRAGGSTAEVDESGSSKAEKLSSQNGKRSTKTSASEISSSSSSKPKVQQRTQCPYGTSCYRKNPIHFQECSHPGDDDYEEEQSNGDEDDDRPECPYGTDCYRKNPLHKKEYKHTKPPARKLSVPDDDEEEDEDRYENSFINDESEEEEVDEDSDYVPESDDSGKEDIKRLQKEAKAFLRKKKK